MKKKNLASPPESLGVIHEKGASTSGLNLGGLGSGGVEIWPDGRFHHWNIANSMPWTTHSNEWGQHGIPQPQVPAGDADVFLRVEGPHLPRPLYRWLFTGHGYLCTTASHFWRVHKYFFIRSMEAIDYEVEFPFARLTYRDPEFPLTVTLRAWFPFVPRDDKASSLPGFYLDYAVVNASREPLHVSLVWQMVNFSGFAAEKNTQRHTRSSHHQATLLHLEGSLADPTHDSSGGKVMWANPLPGQKLTSVAANPYMQNLIWSVHRTGGLAGPLLPPRLLREEMVETPRTNAPNKGWLCLEEDLAPGQGTSFQLGLAWYFPNHRSPEKVLLGHVYENWFANAVEVAAHLIDHRETYLAASQLLPDLVMRSSLPEALRISLLDQLNTLTTNGQFTRAGHYGIQEGQGCAGYNTVDVDHYSSYALALLQPRLREVIDDLNTSLIHPKNGKVRHAIGHSLALPQIDENSTREYNRWDVCCQHCLMVYRDARWSGNGDLLRRNWPSMKRAMDLVASMDFYQMHLPYTEGGITYDHWRMKGVVAYMAGVYLAALRAMTDAALWLGDNDYAELSYQRFRDGAASFEKHFWLGDRYAVFYRRYPRGVSGEYVHEGHEGHLDPQCPAFTGTEPDALFDESKDPGVMTDLLNGEATAAVMGLGGFLDPARVKAQLRLILAKNEQPENRCVVNGSYPDERFLDEWPFMQWQTPWTGTEYFLALQLYCAGLVKDGDRVIDNVLRRHLREGVRFDHGECNNHYARPLCLWGAYAARLGLDYDGYRGILRFHPADGSPAYSGLLATGCLLGWLEYKATTRKTTATLEVRDGHLRLQQWHLPIRKTKPGRAIALLDDRPLALEVSQAGDAVCLRFAEDLLLQRDSVLQVEF